MITAEQRIARRAGIGGSDAAKVVLGADDFGTALDVYASKVLDLPEEKGGAMNAGNHLEAAIRAMTAESLGMAIVEAPKTYIHPTRPYMLAHLDGLTADGGNLEAKALDWRKAKALGEPGTDFCLKHHFVQAQHQMEVTGLPWTYVSYLVSAFDLRVFVVERDPAIGRAIADAEEKFWNEHVLARIPPDGDVRSQLAFNAARWPKATGETLIVSPGSAAEGALIELREAKAAAKAAKQQVDAARVRVENIMGSAPRIEAAWGKATWLPSKSVAWSAVAKELRAPKDLIARHTSYGRTFRASLGADDDE